MRHTKNSVGITDRDRGRNGDAHPYCERVSTSTITRCSDIPLTRNLPSVKGPPRSHGTPGVIQRATPLSILVDGGHFERGKIPGSYLFYSKLPHHVESNHTFPRCLPSNYWILVRWVRACVIMISLQRALLEQVQQVQRGLNDATPNLVGSPILNRPDKQRGCNPYQRKHPWRSDPPTT